MVIGWLGLGREMRKSVGDEGRGWGVVERSGAEGLRKGMNGVSEEEDFDRKEVTLRD